MPICQRLRSTGWDISGIILDGVEFDAAFHQAPLLTGTVVCSAFRQVIYYGSPGEDASAIINSISFDAQGESPGVPWGTVAYAYQPNTTFLFAAQPETGIIPSAFYGCRTQYIVSPGEVITVLVAQQPFINSQTEPGSNGEIKGGSFCANGYYVNNTNKCIIADLRAINLAGGLCNLWGNSHVSPNYGSPVTENGAFPNPPLLGGPDAKGVMKIQLA
jgi:hypothetical protein